VSEPDNDETMTAIGELVGAIGAARPTGRNPVYIQAIADETNVVHHMPPDMGGGDDWHGLDSDALTAAHCAVETELCALRDARITIVGPANGFVVHEYDGATSGLMRLGTRTGVAIGIAAYLATLDAKRIAADDWDLHDFLVAKGWVE
jgi:hypothetical protein